MSSAVSKIIGAGFFITISSSRNKGAIDIVCSNTPAVHEKARIYGYRIGPLDSISGENPLDTAMKDILKRIEADNT